MVYTDKKELVCSENNDVTSNITATMVHAFACYKIVLNAEEKPIDYIFLDVNPAYEKLTGLKKEQIIGKKASEGTPEIDKENADWIALFGKVAATKEPVSFESYSKLMQKWLSIALFCPKHGYVAALFDDITERKKAEEELKRINTELEERVYKRTQEYSSERIRLYNVLETIPAYVVLLDKEHRVPFANKVFRERFGESMGRRCYEFLFKRNSPCENCETFKVLETNAPHRWEWTGPDGRNYDIYDFPFPEAHASVLILEMGIDITERKKAEEQLRAVSLYTRGLLEANLDALVMINAEGKITDVNKATEQATGCPRERLIGTDFSEYFTEPEKARAGYQKVLAEGSIRDYSLTIRHATGKTTDVHYNATVYRNENNTVQGIFAAARDVTERRRAEEALQKRDEIISKLSTPLVSIGEGIVMVPVIGVLDSTRARQLTESVLEHIAHSNTEMVVMDISGIAAIDTKTANYILRTVQAVKLMGSEFIITGIRPDVAATLVTLGVDLTGIVTRGSLQEGLQHAYAKLGFKLTRSIQE